MTDKEIIALCRNEQTLEQGFTCLVSVYTKKIYWHIRRMIPDHDDANDVVQNCFIKVWKGISNFREDSKLYTWLYRIATNEAITFMNDRHRKQVVPMTTPGTDDNDHTQRISDEPWLDMEAVQKNLQAAIDTLPDKQKQVFVMRYFDELKYEDMEEILGTSQGALKASFHHAVKKIEHYLKQTLNQ